MLLLVWCVIFLSNLSFVLTDLILFCSSEDQQTGKASDFGENQVRIFVGGWYTGGKGGMKCFSHNR
jgi:hypothetical protein